jgi:sulfite reductase beta subunit-like hemoprotein
MALIANVTERQSLISRGVSDDRAHVVSGLAMLVNMSTTSDSGRRVSISCVAAAALRSLCRLSNRSSDGDLRRSYR